MVSDLRLDAINTHLPLRERIRVALGRQKAELNRASAMASATPEQIKELNASLGVLIELTGNRTRYAEHVSKIDYKPDHGNALVSLGNQIEDATTRHEAAKRAVFGDSAAQVFDSEVEAILRVYLEQKGVAYDPAR